MLLLLIIFIGAVVLMLMLIIFIVVVFIRFLDLCPGLGYPFLGYCHSEVDRHPLSCNKLCDDDADSWGGGSSDHYDDDVDFNANDNHDICQCP